MTPGDRIYDLKELAKLSGRDYWFWDEECRSGRLPHFRRCEGGKRYVFESGYREWAEGLVAGTQAQEEEQEAEADRALASASGADYDFSGFEPY